MATVYFGGGEDCDFYQVGGGTVTTDVFYYRTTYARCALLGSTAPSTCYWQNWLPFNVSTFWTSARLSWRAGSFGSATIRAFGWCDSANVERLRVSSVGTNLFKVEKVDGSGTSTQLGSNFTLVPSDLSGAPDKLDVYMVYNSVGTFTLYWNGVQYFTYSGDVTTNSATAVAFVRMGGVASGGGGAWSELIIADTDTRSANLQTLAPVANGNTHDFDTGSPAAANVNEITLNDATLDGSTTAGQIDQYTIPSIAGGTYTIWSIGVSARMQKGVSGPSKMDLGVRSGGVDYWSSDQTLTVAWTDYQNWWSTDPNTSATWGGLPVNIGLKSVT